MNLWIAFVAFLLAPSTAHVLDKLTGHFPRHPLVVHVPDALAPVIGLFVYDFFYYWFHRAQHVFPALWKIHSLHHSEENVDVLASIRHHWLELPLRVVLLALPMGLLIEISKDGPAPFLVMAVLSQWPYFIHANVKLDMGPLTPVLAGPQYHRVHHSLEQQHWNKNFSAYFPIWDVLFGTYCRTHTFPATGISSQSGLPLSSSPLYSPTRLGELFRWSKSSR